MKVTGRPLVSRRKIGYALDLAALRRLRRACLEDLRIKTDRYVTISEAVRRIERALAPFCKTRSRARG